jgi:cellulose synthase/poly-beta-1,6-N-acetylglucosamine synthase-like glycosyltransferase
LATGDVVVLSDANNFYRPDTIRRLVEPFADLSVGAVSGSKMTSSGPRDLQLGESLYWRYEKLIKQSEDSLASCTSASGEILALRREFVEPLPVDIGLDDFVRLLDILKRGRRVAFAPEAVSIEPTSASLADERARRERMTAARWRLLAHPTRFPLHRPIVMWQIASHKLGRLFLPLFAVVALLSNLGEVVLDRRRGLRGPMTTLIAQAAFYGAGAIGPHLGLSGRADSLARLPRYLITTNFATLRGLRTAVQGRSGATWTRVERHEDAVGCSPATG